MLFNVQGAFQLYSIYMLLVAYRKSNFIKELTSTEEFFCQIKVNNYGMFPFVVD